MRINKFIAQASGLSRRRADAAIAGGRVTVNGQPAALGSDAGPADQVRLDGRPLTLKPTHMTIMLNKPPGYVVSRAGQGSRTIYDLLPPAYQHFKPVGRLDKDSSGLLLLTDDGDLANELAHPSRQKTKVYHVTLDKSLAPPDRRIISGPGVRLDDGASKLQLKRLANDYHWQVTMHQGRNRQIRRTFAALGYSVIFLHRTQFGPNSLAGLPSGHLKLLS